MDIVIYYAEDKTAAEEMAQKIISAHLMHNPYKFIECAARVLMTSVTLENFRAMPHIMAVLADDVKDLNAAQCVVNAWRNESFNASLLAVYLVPAGANAMTVNSPKVLNNC